LIKIFICFNIPIEGISKLTMSDSILYHSDHQCLPEDGLQMYLANEEVFPEMEENMCIALPANSLAAANTFLEHIDSGANFGSLGLSQLGAEIPTLRADYERLIKDFEKELTDKIKRHNDTSRKIKRLKKELTNRLMNLKKSSSAKNKLESELAKALRSQTELPRKKGEIARWAVGERTKIARAIRGRQGDSIQIILNLTDRIIYGKGGRTYPNMFTRKIRKETPLNLVDDKIIEGAVKINEKFSKLAYKSAKYLKHGGKIILVFSISYTAYTYLTADESEIEKLVYEDAGGLIGGGVGVGACLVFGIATGGWGLLACGVVGGVGGSMAGEQLYYSKMNREIIKEEMEMIQMIAFEDLNDEMPMCY